MAKLNPLDTSRWTRDDFIREARLQTDAIQRLNVWLRLGYSLVAVGFLLGYGVLRRLWRRVGYCGRGGARAGCAHVRGAQGGDH